MKLRKSPWRIKPFVRGPRLHPVAFLGLRLTGRQSGLRSGVSPFRLRPIVRLMPRLSPFAWLGSFFRLGGSKEEDES